MKIKLQVDSRDDHLYTHAGQTTPILSEAHFDDPNIPNPVQTLGDVKCTCYSCEYVAQNFTKVAYDIQELFNRVPHDRFGASPRDVMGEVIKNGLKRLDNGQYEKPFKAYSRADTGNLGSPFSNMMASMSFVQNVGLIWTNWYQEWLNLAPNAVMPVGKTIVSAHMYASMGWGVFTTRVVQGETMFEIEYWGGQKLLMPADTFNTAISAMGCGAAIFLTEELETKREKTIMEKIIDLCKNAILLLQQLNQSQMTQPIIPPVTEPQLSTIPEPIVNQTKIQKWAGLIEKFEGADPSLNNPGNFKYSTLLGTWGGQKSGAAGSDGGYFCKFPNYQTGFQALVNFLMLGCEDELKDYHQARTIKEFTLVYTNHPIPKYDYSDNLIRELGVTADTQISTFLS